MADLGDEVLADALVLFGRKMEGVGDDFVGKQIIGEVDLCSGSRPVMVAVGGERLCVPLGHDLAGSVFDDHPQNRAILECKG